MGAYGPAGGKPPKNPARVPEFSLRHDPAGPVGLVNLPSVLPVRVEGPMDKFKIPTSETRDCVIDGTKTRLHFNGGDQIDLILAQQCGYVAELPSGSIYDEKGDTVAFTRTVNLGSVGGEPIAGTTEEAIGSSGRLPEVDPANPGELRTFEVGPATGSDVDDPKGYPDSVLPDLGEGDVAKDDEPKPDEREAKGPDKTPGDPKPAKNAAAKGPSENR